MEKEEFQTTETYVVVNYGPEGDTRERPCFLIDPAKGTAGKFTFNLSKAALFYLHSEAEKAKEEVDSQLRRDKHVLAGRIYIAEIFSRRLESEREVE